ncbi:MAG: 16S rRNA (cytosine(1402)-N(4))-methyltransferase RsmH, partial [Patescibacteria group bacterium]
EDKIADVIRLYGEERFARRIAAGIIRARRENRIRTSAQLTLVITRSVPRAARGRIHPATRTFQALRIAVNDELGSVERVLPVASNLLASGGRLAVISFHSIEDRIVKNVLKDAAHNGLGTIMKKPIVPTRAEVLANRRARSAKLRVFNRIPVVHAGLVNSGPVINSYA